MPAIRSRGRATSESVHLSGLQVAS